MAGIKCIGILTSGGDAPGMNAAIRAVTRSAIFNGFTVKGIMRGYKGLVFNEIVEFKSQSVSNIIQLGGTILKTARSQEFTTPEGRKAAYDNMVAAGIDALCGAVHDLLKMRRLHVVMGMVCDKEYEYCVHRMARQADAFYACTTNAAERSLGEQTIASLAEQECGEVYDCRSTEHALEHASPTDCILVCGSLFLTGEAEKILRGRPKTTD